MMVASPLRKTEVSLGRVVGPSPAENRYYVLVLFDISEQKKYRLLLKILNRYGSRIQKSVFEAQLKASQIRELSESLERLMSSERFCNPNDNIRVYKVSGNCTATVLGDYKSNLMEENIFL